MLEGLLKDLGERIEAHPAQGLDCVYELRFVGEEQRSYLDFSGEKAQLLAESPAGELCSLGLHIEDLDDLLAERVSLKVLFASGRLRVFGDIGAAMKLEILFSRS